jgi:hypothetical protein
MSYDMAAEISLGAAALIYLTAEPGRWEKFARFAMLGAIPDVRPELVSAPAGRNAAVHLLGLAAAAIHTGDELAT